MSTKLSYRSTVIACYQGIVSQAIINNLAPLLFVIFQDHFGISLEKIGLLVMLNFGTQLVVDALSVKFADRIGYRRLMVFAHICCVVGLFLLGILPRVMQPAYTGFCIAVITYAIGGGLLEVLVSPIVEGVPKEKGSSAAAMSLLHSFYCWGHVVVVLLTTLLLQLLGDVRWYVLPLLWAVVPAINIVQFMHVPLPPVLAEHERMPLKQMLTNKLFLLAILLMICSGAAEQAMSQWASLFAEKGLQVSKVMGDLLGPCLFAVFMGLGRTGYGILGERLNLNRALMACASLCIVCYLMASLITQPLLALVGCALCGLSVSLMWPGMVSLSARMFSTGGTALFGLLAMGGDIGCAIGPWLTGLVSGAAQRSPAILAIGARAGLDSIQTGLKSGLLVAIIFPLVLLIGMIALRKKAE